MSTHGNNNEKEPVYTLLRRKQRLVNKKVKWIIDRVISK